MKDNPFRKPYCWAEGYSDFHILMGFISKKMPNNIFYIVYKKKFFN